MALDPSTVPTSGDPSHVADQLGVTKQEVLDARRQKFAGQVTSAAGQLGEKETQSYTQRSSLPTTGNPISNAVSYFDSDRGVEVFAPYGSYFQLFGGGGVKTVNGALPTDQPQGAPASSLFNQATQADPNNPDQVIATPGFTKDNLAIPAAPGKTVSRTGQTFFDKNRGIDVNATPGNFLIEYTDGTIEERPLNATQQVGTAQDASNFGPSAQDLGITNQTEIKDAQGNVARPAAAGNQGTDASNLELIGTTYTAANGQVRTAPSGQVYLQDPTTGTIVLRPQSDAAKAKPSTSPSITGKTSGSSKESDGLFQQVFGRAPNEQESAYWGSRTDKTGDALFGAMQFAKQQGRTIGDSPTENMQGTQGTSVDKALSSILPDLDISKLSSDINSNPIPTVQSLYGDLQNSMGVPQIKSQIESVLAELKTVDDDYAKDKGKIDANPWLSESLRDREQEALKTTYDAKRSALTARQALYQSLYDDARQEAQFIATNTLSQYNKDRQFQADQLKLAYDRQDAKMDAQIKLASLAQDDKKLAANLALEQQKIAEDQRQFNILHSGTGSRSGSSGGSSGGKLSAAITTKYKLPTTTPASEYNEVINIVNSSPGDGGWGDTADAIAAAGIDPSKYDELLWEVFTGSTRTAALKSQNKSSGSNSSSISSSGFDSL